MTTGTEALVRRAYHFAEGAVLDVRGFTGLFAEDGVFTGIGDPSGPESYRGEHLEDVVAIELSIQDTSLIVVAAMLAQLGVLPDFTSAVAASAPPR